MRWRRSRPLTTEDLIDLSDAITAYVDELVAATTDGFTLQLREQAGERDRRRRLLAEVLVRGSAPERAVLAAAEGIGWRRIDDIVPILLPPEQTRQAQFRYRDEAVVLERERDSVLLLRQRRPASRELLERALKGRGAVVGVTVDWATGAPGGPAGRAHGAAGARRSSTRATRSSRRTISRRWRCAASRPPSPSSPSAGWRPSPRCARRPGSGTSRRSTAGCATGGPAPPSPTSFASIPRP